MSVYEVVTGDRCWTGAGVVFAKWMGSEDFAGTAGLWLKVLLLTSRAVELACAAVSLTRGIGAVSVLASASADPADGGPFWSVGKSFGLMPARFASSIEICGCWEFKFQERRLSSCASDLYSEAEEEGARCTPGRAAVGDETDADVGKGNPPWASRGLRFNWLSNGTVIAVAEPLRSTPAACFASLASSPPALSAPLPSSRSDRVFGEVESGLTGSLCTISTPVTA